MQQLLGLLNGSWVRNNLYHTLSIRPHLCRKFSPSIDALYNGANQKHAKFLCFHSDIVPRYRSTIFFLIFSGLLLLELNKNDFDFELSKTYHLEIISIYKYQLKYFIWVSQYKVTILRINIWLVYIFRCHC